MTEGSSNKVKAGLFVSFALMGLFSFLLSKAGSLADFRKRVSGYVIVKAKKNLGADASVKPTAYPSILRKHLSDFTLSDGRSLDLLTLYPESIHTAGSLASGSCRQMTLCEDDLPCELTLDWKTGIPVEIRISDRLRRPIASYRGSSGREKLNLSGSVYKIHLYYDGLLAKDAAIVLHAGRTTGAAAAGPAGKFEEIPKIGLVFALNIEKGMQRLRKNSVDRLNKLGATGNPIETVNKKVYARLYHSGSAESEVRIWQSGQGQLAHFDERNPSFTAKIVSGPLFYGIRDFKLYTIKSQQGLLDYVIGDLAEKESLFVPRHVLADVTINGRHAGLYVVEETPSTEFFAGKDRYDGFIQSLGKTYFKPAKGESPFDSDNIDTMLKTIDPDKFAKTLALLSRFHGVHGLGDLNLRFYLDPVLHTYEPVLRDININIWDGVRSCGVRELLTYSNFWLGERPFAYGSQTNIKTGDFVSSYPEAPLSEAYTWTTTTLGLANTHPLVQYFMNIPRFRELFEGYLFYFSGKPAEKEFLNLLSGTFDAAQEFLRDDKEYLETIRYQAKEQYRDTPMTIAQFARPLLRKSRILAVPYKSDGDTVLYALLNLSAFSTRMKKDALPPGVEVLDNDIDVNENGYFIAPSKFFAMCINGLYDLKDDFTLDRLTQRSIKKILNIEFSSYLKDSLLEETYVGPKPFIRIRVPKSEEPAFTGAIARGGIFKTAGLEVLNGGQVRFLGSFDPEKPKKIVLNSNKDSGRQLPPVRLGKDLLIQNIGQYPVKNGYLVRYLFLNQSPEAVRVDFGRVRDPRIKKIHASLIYDDKAKAASSSFELAPMKDGPFKTTTGLWIDNFIPLFNGTKNDAGAGIAVVDLYFVITDTKRKEALSCFYMEDTIASFHPDYLYNAVVPPQAAASAAIFAAPFEKWDRSPDGGVLPAGFTYSQSGSGGSAERETSGGNVKEGAASAELKPSSLGNSSLQYTLPGIEKLRGRSVGFSIWVKSGNKSPEAVQLAVLDGAGPPAVISYPDTGKWELLEIKKDVAADAKFLRLKLTVGHTATSPAYFDEARAGYADDKFGVKIHEPYNVPTLPHDALGGGGIEKPFTRIERGRREKEEVVRFKGGICNELLVIKKNQVLVLDPGQVIRFSEKAGIVVYGRISARGKKGREIELLPQKDKWFGLMVINNDEPDKTSYLEHCRVVGAAAGGADFRNSSGGLNFINTHVVLKDVAVENFHSDDSVHFYRSDFEVARLRLKGGIGDGIDSDWSYGKVTESDFRNCGGDCVDLSGSRVVISSSTMAKAHDKGISVGEGCVVSVSGNELDENPIGIAVKDQSLVSGSGNVFNGNTVAAIALYIKKPDYIWPAAALSNSVFHDNNKDILEMDPAKVIREFDFGQTAFQ